MYVLTSVVLFSRFTNSGHKLWVDRGAWSGSLKAEKMKTSFLLVPWARRMMQTKAAMMAAANSATSCANQSGDSSTTHRYRSGGKTSRMFVASRSMTSRTLRGSRGKKQEDPNSSNCRNLQHSTIFIIDSHCHQFFTTLGKETKVKITFALIEAFRRLVGCNPLEALLKERDVQKIAS